MKRVFANFGSVLVFSALLATGLAGCGEADFGRRLLGGSEHGSLVKSTDVRTRDVPALHADAVAEEHVQAADRRSLAVQAAPASAAVSASVTFKKARLFDRAFLYGFDLQYTSQSDPGLQLYSQTQALGHVPAFFRRLGGELQLVADQSRLFESDVNHPELLLASYKITGEDDQTLTVTLESSGTVLNEVANGKGTDAPKESWVRSFKYVEEGDYLLQETALLLKDGSVQTFLESVFPRANLVPDGYSGLEANAQYEPLADRYRFLGGETVFVPKTVNGQTVRLQTSFASRIPLKDNGTIEWYVTPNAPDKFLPVIKSGVEGWNRYFKTQLGRDVMHFAGRLPADVSIGDPRYNVVNFDSVAMAGAAYESQATDPLTGLQSHSLIYFPLAWYNIGAQLWQDRTDLRLPTGPELASKLEPKGADVLFGHGRRVLACVRSTDDAALPASALVSAVAGNVPVTASVDDFSQRLMIGTLFHEVGHSLGFAHNFKGSLSFDGTKPYDPVTNSTTASIMDYDYYQNDVPFFGAIGTSDGPKLEYDRQLLSQLYNAGKDVKATDPVLPACADDEADSTDGGVDPLCVRYDTEQDPSLGIEHAWHNLTAADGAVGVDDRTLSQSLAAVQSSVKGKLSGAAGGDATVKAAATLGGQVGELVNYYLVSGAQSLRSNLLNNDKGLRVWIDGVPVDEAAFRGRYVKALKDALTWRTLPATPAAAVQALADEVSKSVAEGDRAAAAKAFTGAVAAKVDAALTKLRGDYAAKLAFDLKNPFALAYAPGGELSHFEELASQSLEASVVNGLEVRSAKLPAYAKERAAAAKALLTWKGAAPAYDDTVKQLQALIVKGQQAGDARLVDQARILLKALGA